MGVHVKDASTYSHNYIDILHASLACKRGNNEISLWLHFHLRRERLLGSRLHIDAKFLGDAKLGATG